MKRPPAKRHPLAITVLAIAVILVTALGYLQQAKAVVDPVICTPQFEALDGRCMNQSYFSGIDFDRNTMENVFGAQGNQLGSGNYYTYVDQLGNDGVNIWDIPQTIDKNNPNAAQNFVNFMHAYLFNQTLPGVTTAVAGCSFPNSITAPSTGWTIATSKPCDPFRSRMIGSAYLVLTMLGGKYTKYSVGSVFNSGPYANPVQNGVFYAQQEFNTWAAEVMQADANGDVVWNGIASAPDGHPNTGASDYTHDVQMFQQAAEVRHAIIFNNPTGQYVINRRCGNSFGSVAPLAPLTDMNMQAYLGGIYDSTGAPAGTLAPGGTYTIKAGTANIGDGKSNTVYLELKTPGSTTNGPMDTVTGPYGVTDGWSATNNCQPGYAMNPPGACLGKHWWWEYNNIAANSGPIWQTATFTVNPAATGSICFQSDVVHKSSLDPTSYSLSPIVCLPVAVTRYPTVTGYNSDVHAGGGLCDQPQNSSGSVTGYPGAGSLDQYVVSASGVRSNFGTNNNPTNSALALGGIGGYTTVCRPDLYDYATTHIPSGATWFTPPAGASYTLKNGQPTTLPKQFDAGAGRKVAYIQGDVAIHGQLDHSLTLVVSGKVTIDGDITRTGGSNRTNQPVLGIIAHNNVLVQCGCGSDRHVDALIFSDTAINTCDTSTGSCANALYVNGFLMANDILLNRLGDAGTSGSQPAEVVSFDPILYLDPPLFFDQSTEAAVLQAEGERAPLY